MCLLDSWYTLDAFIDDHIRYMEAMHQSSPFLASKKSLLHVTDGKFDFLSVFLLSQHACVLLESLGKRSSLLPQTES